MRHLKITMIVAASLVLTVLMALAGCGEDHGDHFRSDRDRPPEHYERQDNDRHSDRQDSDRHEDRGGNAGHDQGEHGDH
jgi:hypothetical protein